MLFGPIEDTACEDGKPWHPLLQTHSPRDLTLPTIRKTRRRYEIPGEARYLTCSCFHRLPLFDNDRIKDAFTEQLTLTRQRLAFDLLAWVIMPEHFHLLVLPRESLTISHLLSALKRPFATQVLRRWRELDAPILTRLLDRSGQLRFWQQGGGYDRNIVSTDELEEKINYIHNNPVRRGLVSKTTDWKWSSARWYEGDHTSGPPVDPIPL